VAADRCLDEVACHDVERCQGVPGDALLERLTAAAYLDLEEHGPRGDVPAGPDLPAARTAVGRVPVAAQTGQVQVGRLVVEPALTVDLQDARVRGQGGQDGVQVMGSQHVLPVDPGEQGRLAREVLERHGRQPVQRGRGPDAVAGVHRTASWG